MQGTSREKSVTAVPNFVKFYVDNHLHFIYGSHDKPMEDKIDNYVVPLQLRLPPDLLDKLDRYRESHPMRPTRSQVVRVLLQDMLKDEEPERA
jgi:hypothetical protein